MFAHLASFLLLKSLLILANVFFIFCFSDLFPILIFCRYQLNYSSLYRASSTDISSFLILSGKATGSFNILELVSKPLQ